MNQRRKAAPLVIGITPAPLLEQLGAMCLRKIEQLPQLARRYATYPELHVVLYRIRQEVDSDLPLVGDTGVEVGGVVVTGVYPTTTALKIKGLDLPHWLTLSLRWKRVTAIGVLLPDPTVWTVDQ
jgi:hypothetical protein